MPNPFAKDNLIDNLTEQIKQLTAERGGLRGCLLETKNALEDANGLFFSTYTTESKSPYDILIKKIEDML